MWTKPISKLILAGLAVAVLAVPAPARACAFLDRLFGRTSATSVAQTTYAAPYYGPTGVSSVATAAVAMPTTVCSPVATACPSQTCAYVQEVRNLPPERPLLTALFGPRVEQRVDPCTGCTVTTTGPRRWSLFGRTVPVTTTRMACSPTVACSPGAMAASSWVTPSVPACPTASCGAPALPPSQSSIAPGPAPYTLPDTAPADVSPRTFVPSETPPTQQQESQESLQPIPDGSTRFNSTPAPLLPDPGSRTTQLPPRDDRLAVGAPVVRHAAYRAESSAPPAPKLIEVQWQPASR